MSKSTFPFVGYPLSVLSFGRCKKFGSLKLFFLSEDWSNQIFLRLYEWFTNSLSEPSLLFQTSAITVFTHFNLLLQRDEPCIHILKSVIEGLGRNLVKQVIEADQLRMFLPFLILILRMTRYVRYQDLFFWNIFKIDMK